MASGEFERNIIVLVFVIFVVVDFSHGGTKTQSFFCFCGIGDCLILEIIANIPVGM